MPITLFGIIWLAFLVYSCCSKNPHALLGMLLLSTVLQSTNVLVLSGGTGVGPLTITSGVYFLRMALYINQLVLAVRKETIALALFMTVIFLGLVLSDALSGNVILYFLQLLCYAMCFSQILKVEEVYEKAVVERIIINILWFVVIMGAVQFLMSCLIIPKFNIIRLLFYNEQGLTETVQFLIPERYPRLFSTFLEPSYCGAFLTGSFYYLIAQERNLEGNKLLAACVLAEIILTRSSTAYAAMLIGGIIFAVLGKNKRLLYLLLPVAAAGLIVCIVQYDEIISLVAAKFASESGKERNKWNRYAILDFYDHKIIGVGYKQARASSLFYSILAQTGLLGLGSYVSMLGTILHRSLDMPASSEPLTGAKLALITVVVSQVIACPDLDFCVFWYFMFVIAVFYYHEDIHYEYGKDQV
ncbi:MAG: O-antigen ligase family protein [Lachnospiraceae bacterium]|nr:O-antigen ligase family protein [Lachnospiraceae bacterium]